MGGIVGMTGDPSSGVAILGEVFIKLELTRARPLTERGKRMTHRQGFLRQVVCREVLPSQVDKPKQGSYSHYLT